MHSVEERARRAAAAAAIRALEQSERDLDVAAVHARADEHAEVVARLMEDYRQQIDMHSGDAPDQVERNKKLDAIEKDLRLLALIAQREELVKLSRTHLLDEETARKLIREIDLQELRYG